VSAQAVAALIRAHIIATRPRVSGESDFTDAGSLVATGILDSVGVFELVAFLEERFGIEVADEELEWKSFETVEAITRLVESKRAAAGLA
jgi:acyl carrier protein